MAALEGLGAPSPATPARLRVGAKHWHNRNFTALAVAALDKARRARAPGFGVTMDSLGAAVRSVQQEVSKPQKPTSKPCESIRIDSFWVEFDSTMIPIPFRPNFRGDSRFRSKSRIQSQSMGESPIRKASTKRAA
jgi:hypothetical protein